MAQPEQQAREEIDRLLTSAGWRVADLADANIHAARGAAPCLSSTNRQAFTSDLDPEPRARPTFAFHRPELLADWLRYDLSASASGVAEVDHLLSIAREAETEVDTNLKRAHGLRQTTLQRVFSSQ